MVLSLERSILGAIAASTTGCAAVGISRGETSTKHSPFWRERTCHLVTIFAKAVRASTVLESRVAQQQLCHLLLIIDQSMSVATKGELSLPKSRRLAASQECSQLRLCIPPILLHSTHTDAKHVRDLVRTHRAK